MQKKELKSVIFEYDNINELKENEVLLINRAKEFALKAYSPYSKLKVGVALLLNNNEIISGNNQENVAYPSGLCAERVAVFYAGANFPDVPIQSIAICAYEGKKIVSNPICPCGACLQVLIESEIRFQQPIKLILFGEKKIQIVNNVKQLLPLHFEK